MLRFDIFGSCIGSYASTACLTAFSLNPRVPFTMDYEDNKRQRKMLMLTISEVILSILQIFGVWNFHHTRTFPILAKDSSCSTSTTGSSILFVYFLRPCVNPSAISTFCGAFSQHPRIPYAMYRVLFACICNPKKRTVKVIFLKKL